MLQHLTSVSHPPLPWLLDGMDGQEDELQDVKKGKLERPKGETSSGAYDNGDVANTTPSFPEPADPDEPSGLAEKEAEVSRLMRLDPAGS